MFFKFKSPTKAQNVEAFIDFNFVHSLLGENHFFPFENLNSWLFKRLSKQDHMDGWALNVDGKWSFFYLDWWTYKLDLSPMPW